jgi:hypothetical protein
METKHGFQTQGFTKFSAIHTMPLSQKQYEVFNPAPQCVLHLTTLYSAQGISSTKFRANINIGLMYALSHSFVGGLGLVQKSVEFAVSVCLQILKNNHLSSTVLHRGRGLSQYEHSLLYVAAHLLI